jgi:hypothetical protein
MRPQKVAGVVCSRVAQHSCAIVSPSIEPIDSERE